MDGCLKIRQEFLVGSVSLQVLKDRDSSIVERHMCVEKQESLSKRDHFLKAQVGPRMDMVSD